MAAPRQVSFVIRTRTMAECLQLTKEDLCSWTNAVRNVRAFLGYVADVPEVQRRRDEFERLTQYVSDAYDQLHTVLAGRLTELEFEKIEPTITVRNQDNWMQSNVPWYAAYDMCDSAGLYQYWNGHAYDERPDLNKLEFFESLYKWLTGEDVFISGDPAHGSTDGGPDDGTQVHTVVEIGETPLAITEERLQVLPLS